jgi:hypothetical protein
VADGFVVTIENERAVELLLDRFEKSARENVRAIVEAKTAELADRIRAAAPRLTGKLQSSIKEEVRETDDRIRGRVFVSGDFAKAGALEYGAHGTFTRKAHEEKLTHLWARAFMMPEVEVSPTTVHMDLDARRYIRDPFAEMQADIEDELRQALDNAAEEASSD